MEIGHVIYFNHSDELGRVEADRRKLRIQLRLILMFVVGGMAGAFGFKQLGYGTTLPLAALLIVLTMLPMIDDMRLRCRFLRRSI